MSSGLLDPVLHSQYHHLQERDTNDFLLVGASILEWAFLKDEVVLNVGCGPGNTSCAWILSMFPELKRVVAIDASEEMIALAKILNPHPKVDYIVADISERYALECWEGCADKVFSFHCMQFITDIYTALENIFSFLKPGGEAALMFEINSPYHAFYQLLFDRTKWAFLSKGNPKFLEAGSATIDNFPFKKILEEIGFVVVMMRKTQKSFAFSSDENCIGFLLSFCSSLTTSLSNDSIEEFRADFLEILEQNGARDEKGHLTLHYNIETILVKRKS